MIRIKQAIKLFQPQQSFLLIIVKTLAQFLKYHLVDLTKELAFKSRAKNLQDPEITRFCTDSSLRSK